MKQNISYKYFLFARNNLLSNQTKQASGRLNFFTIYNKCVLMLHQFVRVQALYVIFHGHI